MKIQLKSKSNPVVERLVSLVAEFGEIAVKRACKQFLTMKHIGVEKTPRKAISDKTRRAVYEKYGGVCQRLMHEIPYSEASVDHKVAITEGGKDSMLNYTLLCKSCNSSKQDKSILEESKASGRTFKEILN